MNRSQRLGATAAATAALLGGAGMTLAAAQSQAGAAPGPTQPPSAAAETLAGLDAETTRLSAEAEALRSQLAVASRAVDAAHGAPGADHAEGSDREHSVQDREDGHGGGPVTNGEREGDEHEAGDDSGREDADD